MCAGACRSDPFESPNTTQRNESACAAAGRAWPPRTAHRYAPHTAVAVPRPAPTSPPRLSPGLRSMLVASLCFSAMSVMAKQAAVTLPSQQIVLVRAAITLLLSLATLHHLGISPRGKRPGLLILRGVF